MGLLSAVLIRKYFHGKKLFTFFFIFGVFLIYYNKSSSLRVTKVQTHYKLVNEQDVFGSNGNSNSSVQLKTYFNTTLHPPGVIFKAGSGIGNQLFRYACSYALAKDLGWPLYMSYDGLPSTRRTFHPGVREFALDQFEIHLENIINTSTNFSTQVSLVKDREFLQRTFLNKEDPATQFIQLGSYCQSIEFWKNRQEEIKAMFKPRKSAIDLPKLQNVINKISSSGESVAVHIRRGDLTTKDSYVPISFQRLAMTKIINLFKAMGKGKPVFFIFSDDIAYAEIKLKDFANTYEIVYVPREITNSTSIEDFYLMTLCKHIIFPNSTYSWWVAYLIKNKEKIVITSEFNPRFLNSLSRDSFHLELYGKMYHPKEWIVLNPFTGGLLKKIK